MDKENCEDKYILNNNIYKYYSSLPKVISTCILSTSANTTITNGATGAPGAPGPTGAPGATGGSNIIYGETGGGIGTLFFEISNNEIDFTNYFMYKVNYELAVKRNDGNFGTGIVVLQNYYNSSGLVSSNYNVAGFYRDSGSGPAGNIGGTSTYIFLNSVDTDSMMNGEITFMQKQPNIQGQPVSTKSSAVTGGIAIQFTDGVTDPVNYYISFYKVIVLGYPYP
jgi:hypothetical protein